MISQETMNQARQLAAGVVANVYKQVGKTIDVKPLSGNELMVYCFDENDQEIYSGNLEVSDKLSVYHVIPQGEDFKGHGIGNLVAIMDTDKGQLAVTDEGKILFETISTNNPIAKTVISTYPSKSPNIEKLPPVLTDNVSTMLGFSGVEKGGISTGFFSSESEVNREMLVEAVRVLKSQKEEYIVLDEGGGLHHIFSDTTWHPMGEAMEKEGIIYINQPGNTLSLSANEYDEYGEMDSLLPYIQAARNSEKEYTDLLGIKSRMESKGAKASTLGLLGLSGLLQKSTQKVRDAHENFVDKAADIVEEQQATGPKVEKDSDMEEKSRQSSKDQQRSKARKR